MKAILRVKPGEVALVERPTPEPGPGEVRLRVSACGVCGSDVARFREDDPRWNEVVLGHELCGTVDKLGEGVTALGVNQQVALLPLGPDFSCPECQQGRYSLCQSYTFYGSRKDGGLAEYMVALAHNCLPVPADLDPEAGAMLEPLSVAAEACLLAEGVAGKSVLVMGAGAIGLLAVIMALARGARQVIAADVLPDKLALARELGAETILSTEAPAAEQARELTGGGPEVCLECSGHPAAVAEGLAALAPGGHLVLVGTGRGELCLSGEQRERVCRRMLTIRGQWMSYAAPCPGLPWTLPLAYLQQGRIDPRRLITGRHTLEQAPAAIAAMLEPGADDEKVMIRPNMA